MMENLEAKTVTPPADPAMMDDEILANTVLLGGIDTAKMFPGDKTNKVAVAVAYALGACQMLKLFKKDKADAIITQRIAKIMGFKARVQ